MTAKTASNFDYCLELLRATSAKVRAQRSLGRIVVTVRPDLVVEFSPSKSKGAGIWQLRKGSNRKSGVHQLVAYANTLCA